MFKKDDPAIMLLDVSMPRVSGPAMMKSLKSIVGPANAKILLHLDRSEAELQELIESSGADGYIKKTSDTQALDQALRSDL